MITQLRYSAHPEDVKHYDTEKTRKEFLIEKVFSPGAKYYWNEMIEKATGEKLTSKYFAEQFVK